MNFSKKIIITLLLCTILFTACDNANRQVEENINMYTAVWDDVLNKGNLDAIDANFTDDIDNHGRNHYRHRSGQSPLRHIPYCCI